MWIPLPGPVRDGRLEAFEPWQRLFHRLRRGQAHRALRHADFALGTARDRGRARPRAGAFLAPSRVEAHGAGIWREPRVPVAAGMVDRTGVVLRGAGRALPEHGDGPRAVFHGRPGIHLSVAAARKLVFAPARV